MQSSGCLVSNRCAISEARRLQMSSLPVQQRGKRSMQLKFPLSSITPRVNFPSSRMKFESCVEFIEVERANTSSMMGSAASETFVKSSAEQVRLQILIVLLSKAGSTHCWWHLVKSAEPFLKKLPGLQSSVLVGPKLFVDWIAPNKIVSDWQIL